MWLVFHTKCEKVLTNLIWKSFQVWNVLIVLIWLHTTSLHKHCHTGLCWDWSFFRGQQSGYSVQLTSENFCRGVKQCKSNGVSSSANQTLQRWYNVRSQVKVTLMVAAWTDSIRSTNLSAGPLGELWVWSESQAQSQSTLLCTYRLGGSFLLTPWGFSSAHCHTAKCLRLSYRHHEPFVFTFCKSVLDVGFAQGKSPPIIAMWR